MRRSWLLFYGVMGLCVASCANKTYTQEQVAAATKATDAKIGEVAKQVEVTQQEVSIVKRTQEKQREQLARLSDTPKESLARAEARGKLARPAELPAFPWPPPQPTSFMEIQRELLLAAGGPTTWGDVAGKLRGAAERAGYQDYTWFSVPNGFALVLHVEQFDSSGHVKNPRWTTEPTCGEFSLSCITQALFTATPGLYRVVVFVAATGSIKVDLSTTMTMEWARHVWKEGSATFPPRFAQNEFSADHSCLALVYEFEQPGPQSTATFHEISNLTALDHLKGSGYWAKLRGGA